MADTLELGRREVIGGVESRSATLTSALTDRTSAIEGAAGSADDANELRTVQCLTAAGIFDEVRRRLALMGHPWE